MLKRKERIFIVENDERLRTRLTNWFEKKRCEVICMEDLSFVLSEIETSVADCLIIGENITDRLVASKKIAEADKNVRIILLGDREEEIQNLNQVLYIPRPLVAKHIGEEYYKNKLTLDSYEQVFSFGDFSFNNISRLLVFKDKTSQEENTRKLTKTESHILLMLAQKKDTLVSREKIITRIWNENSWRNSRCLDVYITRLRSYLALDENISIHTEQNKGFILQEKKYL